MDWISFSSTSWAKRTERSLTKSVVDTGVKYLVIDKVVIDSKFASKKTCLYLNEPLTLRHSRSTHIIFGDFSTESIWVIWDRALEGGRTREESLYFTPGLLLSLTLTSSYVRSWTLCYPPCPTCQAGTQDPALTATAFSILSSSWRLLRTVWQNLRREVKRGLTFWTMFYQTLSLLVLIYRRAGHAEQATAGCGQSAEQGRQGHQGLREGRAGVLRGCCEEDIKQ